MFLSARSAVLSCEKYLGFPSEFFSRVTLLRSCFSFLSYRNLSASWSSRSDINAFCFNLLLACDAMVLILSLHCPSICLHCFNFCRWSNYLFLKCSCMRCFKSVLICCDRLFSYYYLSCWFRWTCWLRVSLVLMRRISSECLPVYLRRGCGMIRQRRRVARETAKSAGGGLPETIIAQSKSPSL